MVDVNCEFAWQEGNGSVAWVREHINKANVNKKCLSWNKIASHWVAKYCKGPDAEPSFEHIAEVGGRMNSKDKRGLTPLHVASFEGNIDAAVCLLQKYSADPNSTDRSGQTPLLWALYCCCHLKRRQIVRTLLRHNAQVTNVKDKTGESIRERIDRKSDLRELLECFQSFVTMHMLIARMKKYEKKASSSKASSKKLKEDLGNFSILPFDILEYITAFVDPK